MNSKMGMLSAFKDQLFANKCHRPLPIPIANNRAANKPISQVWPEILFRCRKKTRHTTIPAIIKARLLKRLNGSPQSPGAMRSQ